MLFSSITFVFLFLPFSIAGYYILNRLFKNNRINNLFLILVSSFFYWWGGGTDNLKAVIYLMIFTFLSGELIKKYRSKIILFISLAVNISVLLRYKYPSRIMKLIGSDSDPVTVLIPLGISFIIFHLISYLADTYKEEKEDGDERKIRDKTGITGELIDFSTYILFFPKLIQGPIVRYSEIRKELSERTTDFNCLISGTERFIIGFAKKVLIADELGRLHSMVSLSKMDRITAILTIIVYAFQLYTDFSAYSDMAIGIARAFGFRFRENFDFPYQSLSVSEFWRRWHISLGAFFREYVYFPLGGSRRGNVWFNLAAVFFLTGIWHGNTSIYLFWGLYHGFFVLLEKTRFFSFVLEKTPRFLRVIYTDIVVWMGWLAFRLPDKEAFKTFFRFLKGNADNMVQFDYRYFLDTKTVFILVLCFAGSFILNDRILRKVSWYSEKDNITVTLKYIILTALFIFSNAAMVANGFSPFLYFQF